MLRSNLRILMAKHRIDDITELMEKSGLSRNSINKLYRETDLETVKLETLVRLCDTFQCKLSELVEYVPGSRDFRSGGVPLGVLFFIWRLCIFLVFNNHICVVHQYLQ